MEKLSLLLRDSTSQAHREAEGADFIKKLFRGSFSEGEYRGYLWALREIYRVLEEEMHRCQDDPALELVFFPELFRSQALEQDLQAWTQGLELPISPELKRAVSAYTEHLQELGKSGPQLLVAHAYVRYLGDLSGGEILGRVLRSRFEGHSFEFHDYEFSDFDQKKNLYRERLDQIGEMMPEQIEALCEEAATAFKLNGLVFQALSASGVSEVKTATAEVRV